MKKSLSFLATMSLMLSLCSCGNNIPNEPSLATNTGTSMFNQIMETEDGYYYNATCFGDLSLHYYDKATGSSLFLCAKPECTHDGNSFCTATCGGFGGMYTAMYGDYIYISAIDSGEERSEFKLLRASVDGTELTEVCSFMNYNTKEECCRLFGDDTRSMVIHRGYAFVPYFIVTNQEDGAGVGGTAVINVENGKYNLLTEYDSSVTRGPESVTADGDYFYYLINNNGNMTETEIWRYNFITNKEEKLTLRESLYDYIGATFNTTGIRNYMPIDGKIWYIWYDYHNTRAEMFIYNPEDDSTIKPEQFVDKLCTITEEYDDNGELLSINYKTFVQPVIKYDGEYLYIAEKGFYGIEYYDDYLYPFKLHIFTLEGEELGSFIYERESAAQINIVNKTVYIQTTSGVEYCAVSDIINGKTEWKKLYSFEQNEVE